MVSLKRLACGALAGAVALAGHAAEQSEGGSYRIDPAAVAGGGGSSSGGSYSLRGTFGQPAAATLAAASFAMHDGIWAPAAGAVPVDDIFANGFDP
ncbi:MAG TPA: hypothetical protein VKB52_04810 [Rhodanobacteraceae bacterium]|nr:hypothetical protein [Rhodanobacteraceae bacterium]